jgi:prevent-host-death family protein
MKTVPLSEAKAKLSKLIDDVAGRDEEITITRNGKAAAVIISPDQYDGWKETVEIRSNTKFMNEIRRGIGQVRRTKKTYGLAQIFETQD